MMNLYRPVRNKFGLSTLFTVITFALLIVGLGIRGQPVTRANGINEKKNISQPCKIDPKDMVASPGAPPPPTFTKKTSLLPPMELPCLGDGCSINAECVAGAFLSPSGICAMKCCWNSDPSTCSEAAPCH